jgi:hypothetical protein
MAGTYDGSGIGPPGKSYYERSSDALKLVGAGNATGLLATGAAINSLAAKQGVLLWLKFSAGSFALGVLVFAASYWLFFNAWTYGESNFRTVTKMKADGLLAGPTEEGRKGYKTFLWAVGTLKVSVYLFFLGFALAFVDLISL